MDELKEQGNGDEPAPGVHEPLHNEIMFRTALPEHDEDARPTRYYLIYLISGNPGLIEYYRAFLGRLHAGLAQRHAGARVAFEVHGRSQGGFEVGDDQTSSSDDSPQRRRRRQRWRWRQRQRRQRRRDYSLREQVEHVEEAVFDAAAAAAAANGGLEPRVVLMGHSVGGYILMELVRRYRQRLSESKEGGFVGPRIVAGICLFPTIMQITDSKKGVNFKAYSRIPMFPFIAAAFVRVLVLLLPPAWFRAFVQCLSKFHGQNLDITVTFLTSGAVHQAMYMARDEMREITVDKWDSEVWGAEHPSPTNVPRTKLFFYFGENDHWVADHTRDTIMRLRGRGDSGDEWRPWMEVDKMKIPHGFSISHSIEIADKVREFIDTIVELDETPNGTNGDISLGERRPSSTTIGSSRRTSTTK